MSNSTIERKIKGLEERFENEMRIHREGGIHNQGGLGASKPGISRRPRPPPIFPNKEIPAFPPRSPQASETENRMREVYKVSGKLNVNGREYRSLVDDLQHLGELGSGTCGHVVKMLHKPSNTVIAVKQMRRSGNSEETKRILMDLDVVVRSHGCPYIVRCLGCFVTDSDVWICMELMASCFDKLLKRVGAPIPEAILGKVTVATVKALSYLKDEHGVIHRDVKPSNILLDECGNVKLCDFGISGRLVDSKAKTRSAGCAAYMASSGNTSPIVLQRFYHQSQQRRSRADLHAAPRHRSLSREHSTGRSPEPPPRTSRQHPMLGHDAPHSIVANGSAELEPPALHERLHPASPLLITNDKSCEGRSQSLTRAELRNGFRAEPPPPRLHHDDQGWLHSLAGLVKRRLSPYVKWHHLAARRDSLNHHEHHSTAHHAQLRWGTSESWSVPASPLPPRAPPPRPTD
ncbi:hypothetical protein evm_000088 [Chilo suppressalis]|nr:hypothetical protein evm_000088 [Chilo suppressalis]